MVRRVLVALVLCGVGCDSSESTVDTDATSAGGASTSTSSTSIIDGTSSSTTEAAPVFTPQFNTCRRECEFAADCCKAGQEPCPSFEYPGNYGCVDGMCVPPVCDSDETCDAWTAGSTCELIEGLPQCVVLCTNDDPCGALGTGYACGAPTDEGATYCRERCDVGIPCLLDTCNPDGVCECTSTDQCINGFRCDAE